MKFSVQEEYGLRCLIRIAENYSNERGLTIPEISAAEGIAEHSIAKILRELRMNGFLESIRGQAGGYTLSKKPEKIIIGDVLNAMGGRLFDNTFCRDHAGLSSICNHSVDCSVRSVWQLIQASVDNVVNNLTLKDLMTSESTILDKFDIIENNELSPD